MAYTYGRCTTVRRLMDIFNCSCCENIYLYFVSCCPVRYVPCVQVKSTDTDTDTDIIRV